MKKKLIRRIRILFIVLFVLSALLAGLIYFAYQHSFKIPGFVIDRARDYTVAFHNVDFTIDKAQFNVSRHTIRIKGLQLKVPENQPFFKAETANLFLASGTGILDYYYARAAIERIDLDGITIDNTVKRPISEEKFENPINKIPAGEVNVTNLNLQTETACFSFPDFKGNLVKGVTTANINASVARGPFGGVGSLKGLIDMVGKDSRLRLSWKHENLGLFTPLALVKHLFGLAISDGKLEIDLDWSGDLAQRVNSPTEKIARLFNEELKGYVKLHTSDFSWTDFSGALNFEAEKLATSPWLLKIENKNEDSQLHLDAVWLGNEDSLTEFKADFSGQRLRISEKFLGYLGLKLMNTVPGQLDFSGKIEGNLNRIQGKGSATAKNWSYQGKAIRTAGIDWYLTDDHWLELQAELDSNIGQADAMVRIGLPQSEKGRCIIDGNLSSVALQSLKPFIDSPVSGKCSGPFKIDFNFFNPATATYDLLLEMREGEFYSFRPELVTARVYGTGADWNLEDPVAEFYEGGNIVVDGILSAKKLDAKVKVEDVALSTFGVSSDIASGNASLIAEVKGSIQQPELVGDLYGSNLYLMGQKVNSFKSRLSLKDKKLDLSPLVLVPFDEGMIDGFYSLDLETGKTRSLKFNFQRLSLEFIKSLLPDNYSTYGLTGRIAGSISFDGQKEQNYWDFFVDGRRLNLFDHDIDTLFLEGSVYGNQGEIRNLFVRAFGGKFNLSGQVLGSDKFDGMIEAESIYLDRISILKEFVPGVRGEINFQGNIEWEGPEKTGYFTLFGDRIKVQDRDLGNLGAEIVIDNEGMRIVKAEFDKLGVYLDGNIDWKGRKPYQADLKLTNVDLSFLTKAHGIKTFEYGGLTVDGQCSMAGDLASLTPDVVEMQLDSIKIQKENDVIVSNKPMQLKYQNNNLEVRSLELKYRQGILGIEGIHKPGEETALMLNGTDFSIKALGRLLDLPEWDYDGRLSANASVFGNYPDLKVRADARIDEFDIADRKISGVTAKISGDTRILNLEEFKVQLPASSFELKGKVGIKDLQEIDNIDLLLAIPKGPISDLPTLMPSIFRQASGTIAADLSLKGDPNSPQLEGELALSADELGISGMRKPFKDVRFEVSTEDSIINIDELQGKLGAGKILGEGQINFRDGPGSITARISGEKIDFSFLNFEINKASATFDVGGNLYNPEIMGKVHVPRGKFFINTDLLKDRPGLNLFLNSLKYNIDVEVPRNFWLKSSFLNAEMRGKFSIMGDLDQVKLDGGISCVQGWLYFQKRKFRIDTGKVRFGGVEDAFDPHIFIKSEGRVQNTQVYLTLQGRVSSFTPKIYSSPPMSEGDLLALLTLGRDMTSAMQSDSKELFENEILDGLKNSYISALIGNTISTALNLDELFLTSLYDKTEGRSRSFIRAGKYIGNNIFMAYEGTLDERDEETFIFEYRLPKGFVVNLEFEEPEKDKRIGVRYDWKFW